MRRCSARTCILVKVKGLAKDTRLLLVFAGILLALMCVVIARERGCLVGLLRVVSGRKTVTKKPPTLCIRHQRLAELYPRIQQEQL